jgi:flavin-dependent thymidylate synthase
MKVIIAGYNKTSEDNLSPEVISASYARTSRQEKTIPEIREEAKTDLIKARESNRNIVYGVGHSSIAEHVVFNIDIIGVSRFLVEEIESHRLASYTEKSQRYVLFDGDYTVPKELSLLDREEFIKLVVEQDDFYFKLYPKLLEYFKNKNPEKYEKEPKTVEGWAKEDARYIISLATQTQLGMTINARNLELMIRRLRACPFIEAQELADQLYEKVYSIAPSLFPYVEPSQLEIKNKKRLYYTSMQGYGFSTKVFLDNFADKNLDQKLAEYLICEDDDPKDYKSIILNSLEGMKSFDSVPREFEVIGFEFILVVSASCYAQLKRHRMMTLIPFPYSIGYTEIPESVIETGMKDDFMKIIFKTNEFFEKTKNYYCLTNAHTRTVYVKINLREMYHFCRMRMDNHAQWEIRELANLMHAEASYLCPIGMSLCCGKDKFQEVYDSVFTKK